MLTLGRTQWDTDNFCICCFLPFSSAKTNVYGKQECLGAMDRVSFTVMQVFLLCLTPWGFSGCWPLPLHRGVSGIWVVAVPLFGRCFPNTHKALGSGHSTTLTKCSGSRL